MMAISQQNHRLTGWPTGRHCTVCLSDRGLVIHPPGRVLQPAGSRSVHRHHFTSSIWIHLSLFLQLGWNAICLVLQTVDGGERFVIDFSVYNKKKSAAPWHKQSALTFLHISLSCSRVSATTVTPPSHTKLELMTNCLQHIVCHNTYSKNVMPEKMPAPDVDLPREWYLGTTA